FDQLTVSGKVRLEGYEPWLSVAGVQASEALPIEGVLKMSGSAELPTRQCSVVVGNPEDAARLSVVARFGWSSTSGGETTLAVDALKVGHVAVPARLPPEWAVPPAVAEMLAAQ